MSEAMTEAVPSPDLRDFVAVLNDQALGLERRTRVVAVALRQAVADFRAQVAPLCVDQFRYLMLAREAGLEDPEDHAGRSGAR